MRIIRSVTGTFVSLLLAAVMLFTINSVVDASSTTTISDFRNTYLVKTSDGYMIFCGRDNNNYIAEYFDSDYNQISSKTINKELSKFGGFFASGSYYYILTGQDNDDQSNSVECFRVTKYDKSWNRVKACSISNCNTVAPFTTYNEKSPLGRHASFDISGNNLVIRTCHLSYKAGDDNQNIQSNMVLMIDVSTMTLKDKMTDMGIETQGYVSHSFAQYTKIDNGHIIGADIGNAYPRGITISYYKNDISSGKFNDGEDDFCNYQVPMEFASYLGDPDVKATLGGLEVSGNGPIVAGTTINQGNYASGKTYNVFVASASKTADQCNFSMITNNAEGSDSCKNVHIVKINSNKFCVIWQKGTNTVQYAFVDGNGSLMGSIYSEAGDIGRCDPIYDNGRIIWFWDDMGPDGPIIDFCMVDASTGAYSCTKKISISSANILGVPANAIFTGFDIEPALTVKFGDEVLTEGVDYSVRYNNNKNANSSLYAEIYVDGMGKYDSTKRMTFRIKPAPSSSVTLAEPCVMSYTGSSVLPTPVFTLGNYRLVSGTDYTITVDDDATSIGAHTATVKFRKNFEGTLTLNYTIAQTDDKDIGKQIITPPTATYDFGNALTPDPVIKDKNSGATLVKGTDYTVVYSNNVNAGAGTMLIKGAGNYSGQTEVSFPINQYDLSGVTLKLTSSSYTYTGSAIVPEFTLSKNGYTLVKGTDFTYNSTNNTNVGKFTATVSGTGNFKGTKSFDITINAKPISEVTVTGIGSVPYTGSAQEPSFTLKDGSRTLTAGTDYTFSFSDNVSVGTAYLNLTGKGNYTGTYKYAFSIGGLSLSDSSCTMTLGTTSYTYTGLECKPSVTVKYGSSTLASGTDYKITYTNNTNAGKATVTVTGLKNYTGTKQATFTINARSILNLTFSSISDVTYSGVAFEPGITIKDGSKTLTKDTDFTVSYSNNVNPGTASAVVSGKGNYSGTKTLTFKIMGKQISGAAIAVADCTYTGKAQTPSVTVTDDKTRLTQGTDYTVAYKNNTNAGTATVTVTGIGHYTGSASKNFTIKACPISEAGAIELDTVDYDGTAHKPDVQLVFGSGRLVNGTDYSLSYKNNTDAGQATVTATGKGNFTGSRTFYFMIEARSISGASVASIAAVPYTGSAYTPSVTVKIDSVQLTEGTDYTLSYKNNTNPGTATVTITGKGNYKDTKTATFTISAKSIASMTLSDIASCEYNGSAQEPAVTIYDGTTRLVAGTHYKVSYSKNTNAGTASVTITGITPYGGTINTGFTITPRSLSKDVTASSISAVTYNGSDQTPNMTLTYNGKTLTKGTDYTLSYDNNRNAGTSAKVIATGTGNFKGTLTATFTINARSISNASIGSIGNITYTGSAIEPAVTVTDGSTTLKKGTDYKVSYSDNVKAGTATVKIEGMGNYSGSKTTTFAIVADTSNFAVSKIDDQVYDGSAKTPAVTVKDGDKTLTLNTDYTVKYDDNVNAGTATVTVTGKGYYSGSVTVMFKITAKSISGAVISKLSDYTYTGSEIKPVPTVTDNNKTLKLDQDYYLEYTNNTDSGEATVTVKGKGNYKSSVSASFKITPKRVTPSISDIVDQRYSGSKIEPVLTVKAGSVTLKSGKDYKVTYKDNINAGTATATVTCTGNYTGSASKTFKIAARSIASATVSSIQQQIYTGSAITPAVTVTDGSVTLVEGTDYTLSFANNIDKGTATITISGKGNYNETAVMQFQIVAKENFTGWKYDSKGKKKYYYKDGSKVKGLQKIGSKRYYFDKSTGKIVSGWKTVSKKKYYFSKTSFAATTGGKKIGKYYYLFSTSGVMQKSGWKSDSKGNTYYLKKDGKAYTKKWAKKKGKWYYFGSNGKMVKGRSLKIGKKTYKFKSNGICKNP